ncbi:MAG TPA: hypothetical protein VGB45_04445 [Abditibacterium sp.]|jgi:hypothetical protein
MEEIEQLWNDFKNRPFPRGWSERGFDIADLAEVDGASAGCISTFIHNKGTLDEPRKVGLQGCIQCLREMEKSVGDDDLRLKMYITELLILSRKVLALS